MVHRPPAAPHHELRCAIAIGKKTGGRDFKPGQSGNPKGRPPVPPDLLAARKVNQFEFERIVNRLLFMSRAELLRVAKDPETPALECMLAKHVRIAAITGDWRRIEAICGRTIGKVDTRVKVGEPPPAAEGGKRPEEMTQEERDAEARELAERILKGA